MRLRAHDAAAQKDARRSGGEHHRVQQLGQAMRHEIPRWMIRRQLRRRHAGTRFDGRARGQSFDAVTVESTDAWKFVAAFTGHADVAELGVVHAEHRLAAHDRADADPRAHRDVSKIFESFRGSPTPLGKRRAVHVGVESDWRTESAAEPCRHVGIAPAGLGGRGDETVGGRARAQVDRTERGDA
jgi:hypothetical protein